MNDDTLPRERLAKRIAGAGLCSRRTAETWIENGRVKVNGKCIITPAFTVTAEDIIQIDGQTLNDKPAARLWMYHKPRGLVTTHRDPQNRPTVFQQFPKEFGHLLSVGRLDVQSEGLLLLTNSGGLARHLELPSTGWIRRYRIRVFQKPTADTLHKLERGVTVDGIRYGSISAQVTQGTGSNCWLEVTLSEGKNRELRRVFEHFGHPVSRLIRVAYGPFQLGELKEGTLKEVQGRVLKSSVPKEVLS